jgi:hypothetical protein
MVLEFAETQHAEPVHISRARFDQPIPLFCPYCRQPVIARGPGLDAHVRPTVLWPHFAHVGPLCQYFEAYDGDDHVRIPLYREFQGYPDPDIVAGRLPTPELYKLQQDAMRYVYAVFYDQSRAGAGASLYRQTDRKLFEWTVGKCVLFTLYCVELRLPHLTLYQIGSSDQSEAAYLRMLAQRFAPTGVLCEMRPRRVLPKMAAVEFYVQHRFRHYRHPFPHDCLAPDIFWFSSQTLEEALAELDRLPYVSNTRREKILMGMMQARMAGKRIGRPAESPERFLRKPKSQQIAALLAKGLAVREVARRVGSSVQTVRKVAALLNAPSPEGRTAKARS